MHLVGSYTHCHIPAGCLKHNVGVMNETNSNSFSVSFSCRNCRACMQLAVRCQNKVSYGTLEGRSLPGLRQQREASACACRSNRSDCSNHSRVLLFCKCVVHILADTNETKQQEIQNVCMRNGIICVTGCCLETEILILRLDILFCFKSIIT